MNLRKAWAAVESDGKGKPKRGAIPCLMGPHQYVYEQAGDDEVVVLVEYRIVRVATRKPAYLKPRAKR